MTPHIDAKYGEIAKNVIMPGDPNRAKLFAETFLNDYKLVSSIRGILAYTGKYNDKEVTIMASGMGMPSMAIYSTELFKFYDVEKIIRIGTCGALKDDFKLNDILLVKDAFTTSNFAYNYTNKNIDLITASLKLNEKIRLNSSFIKEIRAYTTDIFYNEYDNPLIKEKNCDVVEMETFALLYIANHFNKEAASILTVSDSLVTKEKLSSLEREQNLKGACLLALKSL